MSNDLPIGWGDRHNTMSEKDMALGGAAATKFASKNTGAYQAGGDGSYKSSQDVREHYWNLAVDAAQKDDNDVGGASQKTTTSNSSGSLLPIGWGAREKEKEIIAKQQGVFAARSSPGATNCSTTTPVTGSSSSTHAHVALLQVATHSLEALASVLEHSNATMPAEERAKFASAVKRAMDVLAKSR